MAKMVNHLILKRRASAVWGSVPCDVFTERKIEHGTISSAAVSLYPVQRM